MSLISPELWANDSRSETGSIGEDHPIIRRTPQGERRRSQQGEPRLFRGTPCSGLCDGVADEAAERRQWCVADYLTAVRHPSKTLAAALFMFFATLFSTVALGSLAEKRTANRVGLTEYLFMNAVSGVVHTFVGAQPLLVLRPTGPITAITVKLADAADAFGYDFHQLAAATGLWVGLLMAVVAATAASKHIYRLTPFTHDVFACFVCSIYLHDGVSDVIASLGESIFGSRSCFGWGHSICDPPLFSAPSTCTTEAQTSSRNICPPHILVARLVFGESLARFSLRALTRNYGPCGARIWIRFCLYVWRRHAFTPMALRRTGRGVKSSVNDKPSRGWVQLGCGCGGMGWARSGDGRERWLDTRRVEVAHVTTGVRPRVRAGVGQGARHTC
jgi:hypothetical protein